MARVAAWVLAAILTFVALLHFIWGFGIYWPVDSADEFLHTFYGEPGPMPDLRIGFLLGVVLLLGAAWGLLIVHKRNLPGPKWIWAAPMVLMVLVFAIRGIGGYFTYVAGVLEPYVTFNKFIYSPLCLLVSVLGVIILNATLRRN